MPAKIIDHIESIYRKELAKFCPAAADDGVYRKHFTALCAFQALNTIGCFSDWHTDENPQWGTSGLRERALTRRKLYCSN